MFTYAINASRVCEPDAGFEFDEARQYTTLLALYAVKKSFQVELPYDKIVIPVIKPLSFVKSDVLVGIVGISEVNAIVPVLSGRVNVRSAVGAPDKICL